MPSQIHHLDPERNPGRTNAPAATPRGDRPKAPEPLPAPVIVGDSAVKMAEAMALRIGTFAAPASLDEFSARVTECIANLRGIAAAYPELVSDALRARLDNIEVAMGLLEGEARSGGGGGGGMSGSGGGDGGERGRPAATSSSARTRGKESWLTRLAHGFATVAKKLGDVARAIGAALTKVAKATMSAVKTAAISFTQGAVGHSSQALAEAQSSVAKAWAGFWHLAGKVTVGVLVAWLGGQVAPVPLPGT